MKKVVLAITMFMMSCAGSQPVETKEVVDAGQQSEEVPSQEHFNKANACTNLMLITCTKIATCSGTAFKDCVIAFDPDLKCLSFSENEITQCFNDFIDIECTQSLPESCFLLQ